MCVDYYCMTIQKTMKLLFAFITFTIMVTVATINADDFCHGQIGYPCIKEGKNGFCCGNVGCCVIPNWCFCTNTSCACPDKLNNQNGVSFP